MRWDFSAVLIRRLAGSVFATFAVTVVGVGPVLAQNLDCGRLRQQIIDMGNQPQSSDNPDKYAAAARKQSTELARTQAMSHQLGCDGFTFFGGDPRCDGLKQRMQSLQAAIGQLRAQGGGGGGLRGDLVARYNAYCRGQQPRQKGFFESIFGGGNDEQPAPPPLPDLPPGDQDNPGVHGGGQAVCVRTCDGGFFPMGISSHHSTEQLTQMCQALCPGVDTAVYTRSPDAEIKTAVGLDGKPYVDLPNALKFQKTFVPECSCKPAGKTWAEALANAEQVLGTQQKGDIIVTPEKSEEMSRPKMDPATRTNMLRGPHAMADPAKTRAVPATAVTAQALRTDDVTPSVRQVGPQP